MAKKYGKFWCTWQVDRGDRLPLGVPALMVSPQAVESGRVHDRNERYKVDSSARGLKGARVEMEEPEWSNPNADHWRLLGKGLAVDVTAAEMKRYAPFP